MKSYSQFVCQQCGYQSSSFLGKCPECGEWNSLVESIDTTRNDKLQINTNFKLDEKLFKLSDVRSHKVDRVSTGFGEFDRVLGGSASPDSPRVVEAGERASRGGGIVKGSIVLISGDPGIGKSTLLLQTAMKIAGFARGPVSSFLPVGARSNLQSYDDSKNQVELRAAGSPSRTATSRKTDKKSNVKGQLSNVVLYVTGEESANQVKIRADRITRVPENLFILPETNIEVVLAAVAKLLPDLIIVDSIQTLTTEKLTGSAGSVGQLRECAQILQKLAKSTNIPVIIVGHVTKEGNIAGPKILEHLVDAVLNLEGDDVHAFRLLRSSKNRFGSTYEVGVFEMQEAGMVEVDNPSSVFLEQRITNRAGSVVIATLAGGRPILAEVQALCTSTMYPVPTRRVTGLDFSRAQIVMAALAKVLKLSLGNLDIYVNVAGGLKISEPAADLGIALAVASAAVNKPVREGICAFGEVGLLGELRPVINTKLRIAEAKRLGFSEFVSPEKFKTLEEAISWAIHG